MASEPRELEQIGRPEAGHRSGARDGRRGRGGPGGTEPRAVPESAVAAAERAAPATPAPGSRSWVQRHGATVFIGFVFLFLVLLVVVKRLAM